MTKGKNKPPSRARYEEANPTVSCRVSREIYDRLQEIGRTEGKNFSDILKVGLGILEPKAEKHSKIFNHGHAQGYVEGLDDGFRDGEQTYKVMYRCKVCGEFISMESTEEKLAASSYMEEHGLGHVSCHEKAER